jgi:hypothetical protein
MKKSACLIVIILSLLMVFCARGNQTASDSKTAPLDSAPKNAALVITGTLVDREGNPLAGQGMHIYLGHRTTTVEMDKSGAEKRGSLTRIEGTGTLIMRIVGIEEGGALKLINGAVVNPSGKTDAQGRFKFELPPEFIEGEEALIITRDRTNFSTGVTESLPMIDSQGKPAILKIDTKKKKLDLGEIQTL